ncbi:amidohydrolase [Vibrio nigripulchritudo]|uniref:amidohydrolase n=1 Tax=Vibrio nigripulchritudo TaxID=28173 RepID=UPI002490275F|nr:amidohydrolase [Vibrio nigripulchritudo]BDU39252.1 urease [Vibrio nigripulchritudo]BDU44972.1 urease [Vibrio nigripulchritudo]
MKRLLLGCALAFFISPTFAVIKADSVITNAKIYVGKGYRVSSMAIREGKIEYLGDANGVEEYIDVETKVVNANGALVLPGFIDNHNHVFEAASEVGGDCYVDPDVTLEEQIPYLRYCKQYGKDHKWIIGYGFQLDHILHKSNRRTPLQVLDSVFPDKPVILMEQTSHSMWVNSAALKEAGITAKTPHPAGGRILKDKKGKLNGILLDNAGDIVMELAWKSTDNLFEASYRGLLNGLSEASQHGITTIGDGRMYWKRGWLEVWQQAEINNALTARVSLRPWVYPQDDMLEQLKYFERIYRNDDSGWLRIDQVKMYSDGILINGTAKTLAPYLFTYMPKSKDGLYYIPPGKMQEWLHQLNGIGYGAHIHAIGDKAVRASLNAIESLDEDALEVPYTLTHVEMVDVKDVLRFSRLGVSADMQVGSEYAAQRDHSWAKKFLGKKRSHDLMPLHLLYQSGANVTLSSDWNVNPISPLASIANSLRLGKYGLPDIDTAIAAYTINPARSLGIDHITGTLEVGKYADLVVLGEDITKMDAEDIPYAPVWLTMAMGNIVFLLE